MARAYQLHPFLPQPYASNVAGIYAIVNRASNKLYVGSAVHLKHRWSEHRHELVKGEHHSRYLQRAFTKTPDDFYIEVIEEIAEANQNTLLTREQFWINFFKSYLPEFGYNICANARSSQGKKLTLEHRRKLSVASKRPWSEERKKAWKVIRAATQPRGWKWTEEQRKRHSKIYKGRKLPDWIRARMSAAARRRHG